MAEKDSEGGGSSPINLNSLLALVTLAGGVWLISHKLSSDRPLTSASGPKEFVGEQKVEARLWEDPFKTAEEDKEATNDSSEIRLGPLINRIGRRIDATNRVLLLPVMLTSGQYSEDQESRIRSRFAIVSALTRSGYAPEDAEHIGRLTIRWPTQDEVEQAERATNDLPAKLWERAEKRDPAEIGELGEKGNQPGSPNTDVPSKRRQLGCTNSSSRMELRYEWYRPRDFFPHSASNDLRTNVLVLWVNDSYFEDNPLLRLPLLLEPLTDPCRLIETNHPERKEFIQTNIPAVALIGPRRSSTLRSMLNASILNASDGASNLWRAARTTVTNIAVYCATPSAMDEVLVPYPDKIPRLTVQSNLSNIGFKSFHNFAATDAQLAREVFAELALGDIDLKDTNNHVVLISESDTFYARVLSLTYAAELAALQTDPTRWTNTYAFVEDYKWGKKQMPTNLHSFVYLRGLDGQTVKREAGADAGGGDHEHAAKPSLTSFEDLRSWTPDANKAEGRAQFDYLSRLGGRLRDLETTFRREHRGHIKAIGIIGSDVYDTLLILQALRPQFPDVEFFTTDLDARFLSPREREWTRDLLVVSGYGLTLHSDLQKEIPPFRDSAETAQFAATLAALGNTNLEQLVFVPPRRFQIGMHSVVDLSVSNEVFRVTNGLPDKTNGPWLHPLTTSETYEKDHKLIWKFVIWRYFASGFPIIILVLAAVCWYWKPLRNLTLDGRKFPCDELSYTEEDVGGPDGAEALLAVLRVNGDSIFDPLMEQLPEQFRNSFSPPLANAGAEANQNRKLEAPPSASAADAYYEHQLAEGRKKENYLSHEHTKRAEEQHLKQQVEILVVLLNRMLRMLKKEDKEFLPEPKPAAERLRPCFVSEWKRTRPRILSAIYWCVMGGMRDTYCARRFLDRHLKRLTEKNSTGDCRKEHEVAALDAADSARESAREIFRLRCQRLFWFWVGIVIFALLGLALGRAIWSDTFGRPDGEPFSLTSGASDWPAEILRLLVCAAAIGASFSLYRQMRQAFFELTRKFRLSLHSPAKPEPVTGVCILKFWQQHRERGGLAQRLNHIFWPLILYVGVCALVFLFFDERPFDRVRGPVAWWWNRCLIWGSGILFIVLAFLMMDSARMCREFILSLNEGTTNYPEATRRHFVRQRGDIDQDYLSDWIDLQLIVDLTERVGKLLYFPAVLLFLLLVARNGWWDSLTWSAPLILVFAFNLLLALASVFILQRAAREAKSAAEENLAAQIRRLEASTAPSVEQNNVNQAKQLLDEMRSLRRGAFAPFWENPVVGALFLSSGSTTALQVLIWFLHR